MAMLSPGYKYEAQIILLAKIERWQAVQFSGYTYKAQIILLAKIGRWQPVQFFENVTIHRHCFLKKLWSSLFNWISDDVKKTKNQQCLSITCFLKKTQWIVNKNVAGHCLFVNYLSQRKFGNVYIVKSVSLRLMLF